MVWIMKLRSSSASCPNCWRSSFLMSAGLSTFESNEKSMTSSPMSLRNPFNDARSQDDHLSIYHNQALLGCAEVVGCGDLGLLGTRGDLVRRLSFSEIVTDEPDVASLLAFHIQEDSRSWLNFGVV